MGVSAAYTSIIGTTLSGFGRQEPRSLRRYSVYPSDVFLSRANINSFLPSSLDLYAWWNADLGWNESGAITWTDQIKGIVVSDADVNTVSLGSPRRFRSAHHNFHHAIMFDSGALAGTFTTMPTGVNFSVLVLGSTPTNNDKYMWGGTNTFIQNWGLVSQNDSFYRSNKRTFWPSTFTGERMRHFDVSGDNTLGNILFTLDGVRQSGGVSTGATRIVASDFPFILMGATPNGVNPLSYTQAEITDVMFFSETICTLAESGKIYSWWQDLKTGTPAISVPDPVSVAFFYGQSNQVGAGSSAPNRFTQEHGTLKYKKRLLSWYADALEGGQNRSQSGPLFELTYESGTTKCLYDFVNYLAVEQSKPSGNEIDRAFFALNPSVSGRSIDLLATGDDWIRAQDDIGGVTPLLGARTSTFDWILWTHGISDFSNTRSYYAGELEDLYQQIKTEAALSFTGTTPDMIISQSATHRFGTDYLPNTALAALDAAASNTKIFVGFPLYACDWGTGTHLNTEGQLQKGALTAKAMFDIDKNGTMSPVEISSIVSWPVTTTTIVIKITGGNGSYVLDTAWVGAATNSGFDIYSSSDVLEDIITSVTISTDEITITTSVSPSVGAKLTYGWGRSGMSAPINTRIPLGNVRDTDTRVTDIDGTTFNLHGYALIGELIDPN